MVFTDFFIKRPVFSAACSLLLLVIGLIALQSLTLRQYPKIESNIIKISTNYTGASAQTVESFVTTQIENAIAGVDNIDYITSSSSTGESDVTIHLTLNADVNAAMEDINSDLSSVLKKLPDDVDDPVIKKVDSDGAPAIVVAFTSQSRSAEAITDYLTRVVIPQLSTVSGVGSADIFGKRSYAMRLWLDPMKMSALKVTGSDIDDALEDNNVQSQPGEIDRDNQVLSINAHTDLTDVEQFNDMVIKTVDGKLIRLRDVGYAELGASAYDSSFIVAGKKGVGVGIGIKSNANPLAVSAVIKQVLTEVQAQMPADIHMVYARDTSTYIQHSVDEVVRTIIEATLFVFIVIFVFLGSIRSVCIPLVTIPLSLVGAFAFMYALGYSINTLTLLAFVLAIGMVVDDAIVVLENIHRHIEAGLSAFDAAIKGAREICFSVIAMTITLAAVYAPIGFISGYTSSLFKEFAFTLAGTVVLSGVIALILSPMMCAKLLKPAKQEAKFTQKVDWLFEKLMASYQQVLHHVLARPALVFTTLCAVLVLGGIFYQPLKQQSMLAPKEDQGIIIGIGRSPTGSSIRYTETYTAALEPIYQSIPEADLYAIINGHPGGQSKAMTFFGLVDWGKRDRSAQTIQQELTRKTQAIPGMSFMFFSPSSLPGSNAFYPVSFVIKTTGDYDALNEVAQQLVAKLEKNPGILRVSSDLDIDKPELDVTINRDRARSLGITMTDISDALKIALGETTLSSFIRDGSTYDVISQLAAEFRKDPAQLNNITVATDSGELIPLSTFITIQDIVSASSLDHFQQQRATTLNLVLNQNYSEEEAIDFFKQAAQEILPDNMSIDYDGDTRQFIHASSSMQQIFLFALLFIYLVLAAQFESFISPLIVMFTVPLSLVGAFITLYFTGGSLNIYTQIGLVTLVGLISKHGILIVAFAHELRSQYPTIKEAVIAAATVRLRPILMTTAAMVLSACPLVLASGAGAVARAQMGWTIIGGMLFGTVLSLFVIPTMYLLLTRK